MDITLRGNVKAIIWQRVNAELETRSLFVPNDLNKPQEDIFQEGSKPKFEGRLVSVWLSVFIGDIISHEVGDKDVGRE